MIELKILFCQTQFKLGGQQKVLLTIAKALSKRYDVTVYYENHNFYDLGELHTIRPSKSVQILNLGIAAILMIFQKKKRKKIYADLWHLLNMKSRLKNEEYDLVILLNPYILFVEEVKKLINPKKVVCWTHNLFDNYVAGCFKFQNERLFASMKLANQIVSLEKYTADKWKEINPETIIIHNPITIDNNGQLTNLSKKRIIVIGRIQIDSKGLDYLCEIAPLLDSEIEIIVAGSGSDTDEQKFSAMIKVKNLEARINWIGAITGDDLIDLYQSSSLLLMTSRYEGFPLVVGEAMSFGIPFVGFDIPSLREVTENGKYGRLVPIGNMNEMAEVINCMINDREELAKMSALSLVRARQLSLEFIIDNWEKMIIK